MQDEKEKHTKEKKELEAKNEEMERRLEELEDKMRKEEISSKPSLRDLPIVFISAWQHSILTSPQTVTFESFLANFNNADRPGGGDGVLDLDSGVFTCFTPGYYTVSFSAYGGVGPSRTDPHLYLYKNGSELPESLWFFYGSHLKNNAGGTGSRIVVSETFEMFLSTLRINCFPDNPHG